MTPVKSENPLAVITGASTGIGYELAKKFAENGYDLIIAANESRLADAQKNLKAIGTKVDRVQVDLATREGVEELYRQIKAKNRPVDSIALNAGIGVSGKFIETNLEKELDLINLNVVSAVYLAKYVAKDMVEVGHGRILFTSSIVAVMPASFMAVYGASKAFLYSLAEALRVELKDAGVTVTALMPGPTDTQFFARANMGDTKVAHMDKDDPAMVAEQGFKALMEGKDHVLAGSLKVRLQGLMAEIMPKTFSAGQHAKMAEPGSASR